MGELSGESRGHRFYADWRLRLRREDAHGDVCGAGILITMRHVLTCAHVVGGPDEKIWVEFLESPLIEGVGATVVPGPGSWHPPGREEHGLDVALLVLETPRPRARPALLSTDLHAGEEVMSTGYPDYHESGLTLKARLVGPHANWAQLDSANDAVRRGFSGGAVFTVPRDDRPTRVVGMTVGRREDDPALPNGEQHSRSYMIPIGKIAEQVPLVRELSQPGAWDPGFRKRLAAWFTGRWQPGVKICAVAEGGGRDRTLRHELYRAHVHYAGGRTDRGEFAEQLAALIMPESGRLEPLRRWLTTGEDPPAVVRMRPVRGMTVAVTALDRDRDPDGLIKLLGRLRGLGFRLLLTFREGGGEAWHRARCGLLDEALDDCARTGVGRLAELAERQRLTTSEPGAERGPGEHTARRHAEILRRIRRETPPGDHTCCDRRIARLLKLVADLQRDLDLWEKWWR